MGISGLGQRTFALGDGYACVVLNNASYNAIDVSGISSLSVAFTGTAGSTVTIAVLGSMDDSNWFTITSITGDALGLNLHPENYDVGAYQLVKFVASNVDVNHASIRIYATGSETRPTVSTVNTLNESAVVLTDGSHAITGNQSISGTVSCGSIICDPLKTALDGYLTADTVLAAVDTAQTEVNSDVIASCDAYGLAITALQGVNVNQTEVNGDLIAASDAYGLAITALQGVNVNQTAWNTTVLAACDGYTGETDISSLATKVDGYFTSSAAPAVTACGAVATPAKAALRIIPQNAAPSEPVEGDLYVNAEDHKLYFYNGSTWIDLTLGV